MEIWTASHISNINRYNTLIHCINSGKEVLLPLTQSLTHRVSISYTEEMHKNIQELNVIVNNTDVIIYDQGTTKITQFQHLDHILSHVNEEELDPNTMIVFIDDDDLFMSYHVDWPSYDVIKGWQMLPIDYATPNMRQQAVLMDVGKYALELMMRMQENYDREKIQIMLDSRLMITVGVDDFSGYSGRLWTVREVFNEVRDKERSGLLLNMVDLDIMNALDKYDNILDNPEEPFVYHRLMRSKDWINLPDTTL